VKAKYLLPNILFLFFLLFTTSFAVQRTLQGKVMQVKDGDTVVVSPVDERIGVKHSNLESLHYLIPSNHQS